MKRFKLFAAVAAVAIIAPMFFGNSVEAQDWKFWKGLKHYNTAIYAGAETTTTTLSGTARMMRITYPVGSYEDTLNFQVYQSVDAAWRIFSTPFDSLLAAPSLMIRSEWIPMTYATQIKYTSPNAASWLRCEYWW